MKEKSTLPGKKTLEKSTKTASTWDFVCLHRKR